MIKKIMPKKAAQKPSAPPVPAESPRPAHKRPSAAPAAANFKRQGSIADVVAKSARKLFAAEAKEKKLTLDTKKKTPKKIIRPSGANIFVKSEGNPIISPRTENDWEAWQTFNPGVVLLGDKAHFLYRAIGSDGISRFGYAASGDGLLVDERPQYPVFQHAVKGRGFNVFSYFSGGSWGGAEDPRLVRVGGEDVLYVTYTACDDGLRVGLTSIKVDDFLNKRWNWKQPALISRPGEVHKNWVIFPEKINGKYAILHSVNPEPQVKYLDSLEFGDADYVESFHGGSQRHNCWDKWVRGAGAPPVKTRDGWLVFYHAMDDDWSKYKVGAMLLDLNDPTKVLRRSKEPILAPTETYENNGYKSGIIYVSGAIVKDGQMLIYYGCSDSYVCVASANLEEFLESLRKDKKPALKKKTLKKK